MATVLLLQWAALHGSFAPHPANTAGTTPPRRRHSPATADAAT
ncbi:hypothetical protein [Streptomyces tendae]|nr:hypothetical protein [Streptomyces tendae]